MPIAHTKLFLCMPAVLHRISVLTAHAGGHMQVSEMTSLTASRTPQVPLLAAGEAEAEAEADRESHWHTLHTGSNW